jgi:hypothetical protein
MTNHQRIFLTRLVIGYILFFLFLRFFQEATPSGLMKPPLFLVQMDITYWAYRLSPLAAVIIKSKTGSILYDCLLFGTGLASFAFPLKTRLIIPFSLFLFVFILTTNGFGMHHAHWLTGTMIVLFPFWVKDNNKFYLLWQGIRYYTCFLYGMAFIWKTILGDSFFNWQQGLGSFKLNLVTYLYHNPGTLFSSFCRWCIRDGWFLNTGNALIMLLEASMILGFFTKKWDRILFWFPIFIHVTTYFFSDVLFLELLVIDFSFLSIKQLDSLSQYFNKIIPPLARSK